MDTLNQNKKKGSKSITLPKIKLPKLALNDRYMQFFKKYGDKFEKTYGNLKYNVADIKNKYLRKYEKEFDGWTPQNALYTYMKNLYDKQYPGEYKILPFGLKKFK